MFYFHWFCWFSWILNNRQRWNSVSILIFDVEVHKNGLRELYFSFFSLPHHLLVRPSLWRFTRFCGLLLSREKNLCNPNRKTRKASKRKGKKLNWIKWIRVGAWTDDSGFCKSRHVHSYNHQLFSQAEFFSPTPIHRLLCVLFFSFVRWVYIESLCVFEAGHQSEQVHDDGFWSISFAL